MDNDLETGSDSMDFNEQTFMELEGEGEGASSTPTPTPTPAPAPAQEPAQPQPPTPVAQPVATTPQPQPPAPSPAAVPAPVVPPAQPVAAPVPVIPQPPQAPAPSQEEQTRALLAQRDGLVNEIAGRYQISEQDKELLLTEPEKVLPGMIGRLHVDVFEAVLQAMYSQLPNMMKAFSQQQEASRSREGKFYERWPMLNKEEFKPHINRLAAQYRQFNPQATFEQMVEDVGPMALIALKVPFDQAAPTAAAPPQRPTSVPTVAPGYSPAGQHGATPVPAQPNPEEDFWVNLGKID